MMPLEVLPTRQWQVASKSQYSSHPMPVADAHGRDRAHAIVDLHATRVRIRSEVDDFPALGHVPTRDVERVGDLIDGARVAEGFGVVSENYVLPRLSLALLAEHPVDCRRAGQVNGAGNLHRIEPVERVLCCREMYAGKLADRVPDGVVYRAKCHLAAMQVSNRDSHARCRDAYRQRFRSVANH